MNSREQAVNIIGAIRSYLSEKKNLESVLNELRNFDINWQDKDQLTLFHLICDKKIQENIDDKSRLYHVIKIFLENKANPNIKDISGESPFHKICDNERINPSILKLMLDHKADINLPNIKGYTPLHFTCINKNITFEVIEFLINNGADLNIEKHSVVSPNYLLCLNRPKGPLIINKLKMKRQEQIKIMLEQKADPNLSNNQTVTKLQSLYKVNNNPEILSQMIKMMLEHKTDHMSINNTFDATCVNNESIPELNNIISNNNKDIDVRKDDISTVGTSEMRSSNPKFHRYMNVVFIIQKYVMNDISLDSLPSELEKNDIINYVNEADGKSCLHSLCVSDISNGSRVCKIIEIFLENKANPNLQDMIGNTPFHYICQDKNINIAIYNLMLKYGAKLDIKNQIGLTPYDLLQKNEYAKPLIQMKEIGEILSNILERIPLLTKRNKIESLVSLTQRFKKLINEYVDLNLNTPNLVEDQLELLSKEFLKINDYKIYNKDIIEALIEKGYLLQHKEKSSHIRTDDKGRSVLDYLCTNIKVMKLTNKEPNKEELSEYYKLFNFALKIALDRKLAISEKSRDLFPYFTTACATIKNDTYLLNVLNGLSNNESFFRTEENKKSIITILFDTLLATELKFKEIENNFKVIQNIINNLLQNNKCKEAIIKNNHYLTDSLHTLIDKLNEYLIDVKLVDIRDKLINFAEKTIRQLFQFNLKPSINNKDGINSIYVAIEKRLPMQLIKVLIDCKNEENLTPAVAKQYVSFIEHELNKNENHANYYNEIIQYINSKIKLQEAFFIHQQINTNDKDTAIEVPHKEVESDKRIEINYFSGNFIFNSEPNDFNITSAPKKNNSYYRSKRKNKRGANSNYNVKENTIENIQSTHRKSINIVSSSVSNHDTLENDDTYKSEITCTNNNYVVVPLPNDVISNDNLISEVPTPIILLKKSLQHKNNQDTQYIINNNPEECYGYFKESELNPSQYELHIPLKNDNFSNIFYHGRVMVTNNEIDKNIYRLLNFINHYFNNLNEITPKNMKENDFLFATSGSFNNYFVRKHFDLSQNDRSFRDLDIKFAGNLLVDFQDFWKALIEFDKKEEEEKEHIEEQNEYVIKEKELSKLSCDTVYLDEDGKGNISYLKFRWCNLVIEIMAMSYLLKNHKYYYDFRSNSSLLVPRFQNDSLKFDVYSFAKEIKLDLKNNILNCQDEYLSIDNIIANKLKPLFRLFKAISHPALTEQIDRYPEFTDNIPTLDQYRIEQLQDVFSKLAENKKYDKAISTLLEYIIKERNPLDCFAFLAKNKMLAYFFPELKEMVMNLDELPNTTLTFLKEWYCSGFKSQNTINLFRNSFNGTFSPLSINENVSNPESNDVQSNTTTPSTDKKVFSFLVKGSDDESILKLIKTDKENINNDNVILNSYIQIPCPTVFFELNNLLFSAEKSHMNREKILLRGSILGELIRLNKRIEFDDIDNIFRNYIDELNYIDCIIKKDTKQFQELLKKVYKLQNKKDHNSNVKLELCSDHYKFDFTIQDNSIISCQVFKYSYDQLSKGYNWSLYTLIKIKCDENFILRHDSIINSSRYIHDTVCASISGDSLNVSSFHKDTLKEICNRIITPIVTLDHPLNHDMIWELIDFNLKGFNVNYNLKSYSNKSTTKYNASLNSSNSVQYLRKFFNCCDNPRNIFDQLNEYGLLKFTFPTYQSLPHYVKDIMNCLSFRMIPFEKRIVILCNTSRREIDFLNDFSKMLDLNENELNLIRKELNISEVVVEKEEPNINISNNHEFISVENVNSSDSHVINSSNIINTSTPNNINNNIYPSALSEFLDLNKEIIFSVQKNDSANDSVKVTPNRQYSSIFVKEKEIKDNNFKKHNNNTK